MPKTLLLADDSVTIQRVIELTFADEDIRVVPVSDGDQAIAQIEAAPPDIVLADVGMPGRNGYQVAQHIKQSPRLAHIPVMLLTGAFEPVDQVKATQAGCDGVLQKPFEPHMVIARVKELLGRSGSPTAAHDARAASPGLADAHLSSAPLATRRGPVAEPPRPADAGAAVELDTYFDRLDAAFANLSQPDQGDALTPVAAEPPPLEGGFEPPPLVPPVEIGEIDWFGEAPSAPEIAPPDLSLALPEAVAGDRGQERAGPVDDTSPESPVPAAPIEIPSAAATPETPLADAFAALLAAEQQEGPSAVAPRWPASRSAAVVPDDLVEQVTARVLERLSDRVMREAVADLVSRTADRLVREEIERLKASIT